MLRSKRNYQSTAVEHERASARGAKQTDDLAIGIGAITFTWESRKGRLRPQSVRRSMTFSERDNLIVDLCDPAKVRAEMTFNNKSKKHVAGLQ